jgi:hypothetical protein
MTGAINEGAGYAACSGDRVGVVSSDDNVMRDDPFYGRPLTESSFQEGRLLVLSNEIKELGKSINGLSLAPPPCDRKRVVIIDVTAMATDDMATDDMVTDDTGEMATDDTGDMVTGWTVQKTDAVQKTYAMGEQQLHKK